MNKSKTSLSTRIGWAWLLRLAALALALTLGGCASVEVRDTKTKSANDGAVVIRVLPNVAGGLIGGAIIASLINLDVGKINLMPLNKDPAFQSTLDQLRGSVVPLKPPQAPAPVPAAPG